MVFRFLCAFGLIVAVTAFGIWIERESLELNREISRQYYQYDVLEEEVIRLQTEIEQLGASQQVLNSPHSDEKE